jgi:hypothetical protein
MYSSSSSFHLFSGDLELVEKHLKVVNHPPKGGEFYNFFNAKDRNLFNAGHDGVLSKRVCVLTTSRILCDIKSIIRNCSAC